MKNIRIPSRPISSGHPRFSTSRGMFFPNSVPEAAAVRSSLTTSAVTSEVNSLMSLERSSTSSMPRSPSSISALTMFTSASMASSRKPAANAADNSRVSLRATSPVYRSLHAVGRA